MGAPSGRGKDYTGELWEPRVLVMFVYFSREEYVSNVCVHCLN